VPALAAIGVLDYVTDGTRLAQVTDVTAKGDLKVEDARTGKAYPVTAREVADGLWRRVQPREAPDG
jgi:hypothetical protein